MVLRFLAPASLNGGKTGPRKDNIRQLAGGFLVSRTRYRVSSRFFHQGVKGGVVVGKLWVEISRPVDPGRRGFAGQTGG